MDYQMYINGRWVDATDGLRYQRLSPYDGSVVNTYADAGADQLEEAVAAARAAFDHGPWPLMTAKERSAILKKAAAILRSREDEIGAILSGEVGQPKQVGAVRECAGGLEWYSDAAANRRDEAVGAQTDGALGIILRQPVGVVGVLQAWNAPLSIVHKCGPALAVGCTIVTKPPQISSGAIVELARAFEEAGMPPGVFNVVTSSKGYKGGHAGTALAAHRGVDALTFTGSTEVGEQVAAAAANNVKKCVFELGGKSPNVVFPDVADFDFCVKAAWGGIIGLAGQACKAGSRLILHEDIKDRFIEALLPYFSTPVMGDPLDPKTTMGPLVSQRQLGVVEGLVATAVKEGAKILFGGKRPADPALAKGYFYEPTLLDNVLPGTTMDQTEVFGPVLSIMTFKTEAEALAIANGVAYGLAGAVWTADIDRAIYFAKRMQAGTLWVNTYRDSGLVWMPSGGWKASGIGVERSTEGLDDFLATKSVHIKLGGKFA